MLTKMLPKFCYHLGRLRAERPDRRRLDGDADLALLPLDGAAALAAGPRCPPLRKTIHLQSGKRYTT